MIAPLRKPAAFAPVSNDTGRLDLVSLIRQTIREELKPLGFRVERLTADLTGLEEEKLKTRRSAIGELWERIPCFICTEHNKEATYGFCCHREIEVGMAELERQRRP